jgi:hypothetical protein
MLQYGHFFGDSDEKGNSENEMWTINHSKVIKYYSESGNIQNIQM